MQNFFFFINNFVIQIYICKSYNTRFVDAWAPPPIMRKNLILAIVCTSRMEWWVLRLFLYTPKDCIYLRSQKRQIKSFWFWTKVFHGLVPRKSYPWIFTLNLQERLLLLKQNSKIESTYIKSFLTTTNSHVT